MKLNESIGTIINLFGKEIITEHRFIYMLADYYSFRDNPAEKNVILALMNDGYCENFLKIENYSDRSLEVNRIISVICKSYGFRQDLVTKVVKCFLYALNYTPIYTSKEISLNEELNHKSDKRVKKHDTDILSTETTELLNSQFEGGRISEDDIVKLFPVLFEPYLRKSHAHMNAIKVKALLSLSTNDAEMLFSLLVEMGAYEYNNNSGDYDISSIYASSSEMLRRRFRDYHKKGGNIPTRINENYLEDAIQKMVRIGGTSVEQLRNDLKNKASERVYKILYKLKIINDKGQCVTYLTPKDIENKILNEGI